MKKDAIILSISFFLIFLGFNTTLQYFTVAYAQSGLAILSLNALAITFVFFFIGSFLAPFILGRSGLKKGMLLGAAGYALFIFAISTKNLPFVIIAAVIQGISAAILWVGEGAYIIQTTEERKRPLVLGTIISATFAGSFLGIFASSFILRYISFEHLFSLMALVALAGLVLFFFIKEEKIESQKTDLIGLLELFKTKAVFFIPLFFATNLLLGLFVSSVMINLEQLHGIETAGRISSIFWLSAIFTPFAAGLFAERTSKKITLLLLAALLMLSGVLFLLEHTLAAAIAAGLWGVYLAGVLTVGLSAISNLSQDKSRIAGFFQLCLQPGAIFAFIMAGSISYSGAIYITLGTAILGFFLLIFLKE